MTVDTQHPDNAALQDERFKLLVANAISEGISDYFSGTAKAELTSPTPGSTLPGSDVTFAWSAGSGVTEYWLRVGLKKNGTEYYDQSQGTNRSRMVSGLPTDGRTIYVRLHSRIGGNWQYNDYTYTAARGGHPLQGSMSGRWKGTCGRNSVEGSFSIKINVNGGVSGSYSGSLSGKITGSVTQGGVLSTGSGSGSGGVEWRGQLAGGGGNLSGNGSWKKVSGGCLGSSGTWWSS